MKSLEKTPELSKENFFYVDINIGEGRSARIEVREHDDPRVIAADFARLHGMRLDY